MKKIFALALAALMTASMATVAFAADEYAKAEPVVGINTSNAAIDDVYVINSDNQAKDKVQNGQVNGKDLQGGDRIAYPLVLWSDKTSDSANADKLDAADKFEWYTVNSDYDKKVVARADWKVGEAETSIEKVKFADAKKPSGASSEYVYCLVVTLPENNTNKKVDVAGTVQVGRSASAAKDSLSEVEVEFTYYADATDDANVSKDLVEGETGIVDFSNEDGEIDINFEDVATFTVDVDGQDKLNLAWSTDFDTDFGKKYNYANLDFIKFEGEPSFNKNGSLFIYAENKDTFVYEVTEDGAKAVKAEWNADYDAWEIKTRKLTSYVLSDVELDEKTATEESSKPESSKPESGKDNPDTGR